MSILDEITKEKQRVSEALGRVDAQREKLTSQLSELEATERVLARYSKGTQARKTVPATATVATPAPGRGRRTTTARPAGGKRGSSSLNDQVLALATGKTQQESPLHARALARTMSAPRLPGTSGPAASKSAMGSSMPHSRLERSNTSQQSEAGTTRSRGRPQNGCRRRAAREADRPRRIRFRPTKFACQPRMSIWGRVHLLPATAVNGRFEVDLKTRQLVKVEPCP
jgi:hypothetical protein